MKTIGFISEGGTLGGGRSTSIPAAFASHRAWNQLVVWDFPGVEELKLCLLFQANWTRIMSPGEFKQATPRKQQISAENKWALRDLTNNLTLANNRS